MRVVARLVTRTVRCPTPLAGIVGWIVTRMRRASRAAGKASESGGSGVAVGVADGPMLAGALGDGEGVALTDGGRCVANGPTHPAAKTTAAQNSATLVAARAGRPVNLRCGIVALDLRQRRALGEPLRHGTGGDRGPW